MKLSLSTLGCPGWSWNEIFATAKDLGMNGIEVRGVANEMFAPAISVFNQGKRMETLERIEKSGMQLSMLTSGACLGGADSDKYMQEAKAYIDFAEIVKSPYVRVMVSSVPQPTGRPCSNKGAIRATLCLCGGKRGKGSYRDQWRAGEFPGAGADDAHHSFS